MEQAQQILNELEAAGRIMIVSFYLFIYFFVNNLKKTKFKLILNGAVLFYFYLGITFACDK